MIDPGIAGKVVLVTGADQPRGIGAAIARAFAAQGAALLLTALANGETTNEVVADLERSGSAVIFSPEDLADVEAPGRLFDLAETRLGPVEVLVNNAAYCVPDVLKPIAAGATDWNARGLARFDAASHDRHFAVNTRAPALLMQEFARRHAARGARWGRIVNISTDGAECFPGEVSYGASKTALEAFSRAAASEFAPLGITVNIVAPGPIQTGWIEPENEPRIVSETPLGRLGMPDDIADVVVFLASHQARWVTGQRVNVGGGHKM